MPIDSELDLQLNREEEELENEEYSYAIPPQNIYSYTETRSCYDIVRMLSDNDLSRTPDFQREDVWELPQKTRFIDSLLKKLPIPSMCFSVDANDSYIAIDGKQRTGVIFDFLSKNNLDYKLSDLEDVDPRISGKTLKEIHENNPEVFKAVGNLSIPINVIKCDYTRKDNLTYIYRIFQRLNTGGLKLNNQEIRNCVYRGNFIELINDCNKNTNWCNWVEKLANDKRMKGPERILLFLCMHYKLEHYENKLSVFMSDFLAEHQNENDSWLAKQKKLFLNTINIASKIKLDSARNVYVDAILYGISKNINNCKDKSDVELQNLYTTLMSDIAFVPDKLKAGTSNKAQLLERYNAARRIFGE